MNPNMDPEVYRVLHNRVYTTGVPELDNWMAVRRHEQRMREIREMDIVEWAEEIYNAGEIR